MTEVKRLDLGAVSAYALAVEKGYTGTEEEFVEILTNALNYATQAQESASAAAGSAEEAGRYKTQAGEILDSVNLAGTQQIEAIEAAGTQQTNAAKEAIEAKGKETLDSIPDSYETLQGDVTQLRGDLAKKIHAKAIYKNKIDDTKNVPGKLQENGLNTAMTNCKATNWFEIEVGKHYVVQLFDTNNNPVTGYFSYLIADTKADYYQDSSSNILNDYDLVPYINFDAPRTAYCRVSFYLLKNAVKALVKEVDNPVTSYVEWADFGENVYITDIDDYGFVKKEDIEKPNYCRMFNKILCIGDSITEGYRTSGHQIDESRSYPAFLQRMLNNTVDNGGISGQTPKTWYEMRITNSRPFNFSTYDAFIINLGQNEGLTDTLDTDVNPYTNPTDFADTQTGWYCRIIEFIKSQNANCMVFLCKGQKDPTTNSVITKIGEKYNYPVIDYISIDNNLSLPNRHTSNDGTDYTCHFNTLGYFELATAINKGMNDYIKDNIGRFLEVMA